MRDEKEKRLSSIVLVRGLAERADIFEAKLRGLLWGPRGPHYITSPPHSTNPKNNSSGAVEQGSKDCYPICKVLLRVFAPLLDGCSSSRAC